MSELDPDLVPEAWDNALVGDTITPGICTISQGGRVLKWDKKPGFGVNGATTKLTGIEAGEFEMRVDFYDGVLGMTAAEQRTMWEEQILPKLQEAESGKVAIEFYHPAASEAPSFIRAVVPEKVGWLEQDKSDGHWFVVCKFSTFNKPKPATGTPKKAKKADSDQPLDANQKKIDQLTDELKKLNE